MYPELFSVGHFSVATYGVALALAVLAGGWLLARGFVEFLRAKDDRFLGPLTTAQVVAVLLMMAGAALLWRLASGHSTAAERGRAPEGRRRDGWAHESGSRVDRLAAAGQGRVSERP